MSQGPEGAAGVTRPGAAVCDHAQVAHAIPFFLALDDEAAAATRLRGPGVLLESVACHFIEPDSAIADWDMYFQEPSAEAPSVEQLHRWPWPEWVTPPLNDGVEVCALPQRLTRALANASAAELEELAGRWAARLRSENGDEMTAGRAGTSAVLGSRREARRAERSETGPEGSST